MVCIDHPHHCVSQHNAVHRIVINQASPYGYAFARHLGYRELRREIRVVFPAIPAAELDAIMYGVRAAAARG